ncbi:MAG: hypothetical protein QM751_02195 [Paludibacteraceae bacterium]
MPLFKSIEPAKSHTTPATNSIYRLGTEGLKVFIVDDEQGIFK